MKQSLFLLALLVAGCTFQNNNENTLPEIYNLGSRIDYNIYGDGDTTLFFVHGWCINQTYWAGQVDYFKDQYKVVTLDLPGHGKSDQNRSDWTIRNFASDVIMMIDALQLNNVVLIGHSMGGNIILEAAVAKQDAVIGFVGVDNFKDLAVETSDAQKAEMAGFVSQMRMDYEGVVSGFAAGMLFAESTRKKVSDRVMKDILNTPPEISVDIIESLSKVNEVEGAQMQILRVKVNLINADGMPTNESQLAKYCAKSYEVHSIGNTGHYPMVEDPDQFNAILEDILESI
jgi:pimeloyl-ACP methyl ester carboxylesterase